MNDWNRVKEKNKKRLERLNLPNYTSNSKVFIFDKYCPYSLDVIEIQAAVDKDKFGIHGTWAGQVVKVVAGDTVKFYGSGYTFDFDKVVDFCIQNDIRVINSSMTCSYSKKKEAALKRFADWGDIWVSSAGNDDDDRTIKFPANSQYTIGVSAINSEDCNGYEIDVTADSYWYVRNKNKGYFTPFNGTSCSAPVIAGVVRLILDARPEWKLEEVKQFLKENSTVDMESLEKHERFFSFPANFKKEGESMNNPCKVILYHSLTKDGEVVDFEAIKRYHIEKNGWLDIGYHYVIENVGGQYEILKGGDEKSIGAHTKGENGNSIGICLVGNFDVDTVPKGQLEKLVKLIKDIRSRYGNLPIYGHCDYSSKSCPGIKFPWKELGELLEGDKYPNDLSNWI